ncbi:6-phosphogluconolactonase [Pelagicoccus sp. NFK12]|uniref:6-phosphogluconolactonase n=1 Tax=Pelagicoccus enzymogenes TaxID=2773457 RepID=A0A927IFP9_9BACT|nr:6-phosphogluconolactonase [Pelagicoccus enzymogenes]MBD5777883.1 6-phosphogluconolactonase [Pelagicoccus enzymogenes]MDQ8200829.1 6-phosphogluconolactonase [Pelagicoccus enzymogenes]
MTVEKPIKEVKSGSLKVGVYPSRPGMGGAAAAYVTDTLESLLKTKEEVRIVVGSAPSQDEFFAALTSAANRDKVDWGRVVVFHMDEYIGLSASHDQSFRNYQYEHFLKHVSVKAFHEIRGETPDAKAECERLNGLLGEAPIDLVCLGFGENGHLAFNDPPADFSEQQWAKVVQLDQTCRQQQVNDGCFASIDEVPTHAITLTLKVFSTAGVLSGVIPAKTKAAAVKAAVEGPIGGHCPATLCRQHPNARLFLDLDSASLLKL